MKWQATSNPRAGSAEEDEPHGQRSSTFHRVTSKLYVAFRLAQRTVQRKLRGIGLSTATQLYPSLASPSVMQNVRCSQVKLTAHWTLEQWGTWSLEGRSMLRCPTMRCTSLGLAVDPGERELSDCVVPSKKSLTEGRIKVWGLFPQELSTARSSERNC